jgi:hypothetical protein
MEHVKYLLNYNNKYKKIKEKLFSENMKINYSDKYFTHKLNNIFCEDKSLTSK